MSARQVERVKFFSVDAKWFPDGTSVDFFGGLFQAESRSVPRDNISTPSFEAKCPGRIWPAVMRTSISLL